VGFIALQGQEFAGSNVHQAIDLIKNEIAAEEGVNSLDFPAGVRIE
jgi:hypothetical protein